MAFAVPSRAVVETDSNLLCIGFRKREKWNLLFQSKRSCCRCTIQRIFSPKNAREFNPKTKFLIKGAFKLLGE